MNLKKWVTIGVLLLAVLSIPLLTNGLSHPSPAFAANDTQSTNEHTISVDGQGMISVAPDVAYVSLGIETRANTAEQAQKDNAKAFSGLKNVLLQTFKIKDKDIQTSYFQVQPVYSYKNQEQQIIGYTASHNLKITYRDLNGLGKLLDAASKADANRINGIQFDTEKRQEYELQAIQNAMKNAEVKAKVIAESAGASLKGVLQVSQSSSSPGPIMYYGNTKAKMDLAETSISIGQLDITASVHVQYGF